RNAQKNSGDSHSLDGGNARRDVEEVIVNGDDSGSTEQVKVTTTEQKLNAVPVLAESKGDSVSSTTADLVREHTSDAASVSSLPVAPLASSQSSQPNPPL